MWAAYGHMWEHVANLTSSRGLSREGRGKSDTDIGPVLGMTSLSFLRI